eukprot:GILI01013524.1.p1 GENE.GILI01013524.1~~GILI01013524.1.p1  ORF type:complete len:254 (+),score=66.30 GILI01013524.1:105-866(+)
MARNEEKAQAMLNRWISLNKEIEARPKRRRPHLASDCNNLIQAEKFRTEIIREISQKVSEIQNAGLGEHRIRDLNDEINKLLREKGHFEDRIKELGGPDHKAMAPQVLDGAELPGGGGYKYFGAARDLPGVRELFESAVSAPPRRTRGQMYKSIDPDYYGFRDEDDGLLSLVEADAEKKAIEEAVLEWQEQQKEKAHGGQKVQSLSGDDSVPMEESAPIFKSYAPVPSQQDINLALLEKRKQALLDKFLSQVQ